MKLVRSSRVIFDEQERVSKFVLERVPGDPDPIGAAIGMERGGELVGGVVFTKWSGPNVEIHAAGDTRKRWLTHEFLRAIFAFSFLQLGCSRVTAPVLSGNSASLRLCLHVGFEREARLKGIMPGEDLLYLVMWKDRCRWIKEKENGSGTKVRAADTGIFVR